MQEDVGKHVGECRNMYEHVLDPAWRPSVSSNEDPWENIQASQGFNWEYNTF